jgi:hypothetical protein
LAVSTELKTAASPRAAAKARAPVAIVDIGSNSVRLVVYESQLRNAATLQNEKAICGIGRDMVSTGRLHAEGCTEALEALAARRLPPLDLLLVSSNLLGSVALPLEGARGPLRVGVDESLLLPLLLRCRCSCCGAREIARLSTRSRHAMRSNGAVRA